MEEEVARLREEVKALSAGLSNVKDELAVRKLHFKYGYYIDKCLYNEVVDLYADHPDTFVEFLGGRYRRKDGIARLYKDRFQKTFVGGRNGAIHGFLLDHAMMQDIFDVDPSGMKAWGRLRTIMSAGSHDSIADKHPRGIRQWWEGGVYENEYIKEDGVWKIFHLRYFAFWHADFDSGWAHTKPNYVPFMSKTYPEDPTGPDELVEQKILWPDTRTVPFHYPHPVTGRMVDPEDLRAPDIFGGQSVSESDPPLSIASPEPKT